MNINQLKNIMKSKPQASNIGDNDEWNAIETQVGIRLPSDYKDFINEYGTGSINEFMWILTPFDEDEYVNFGKRGEEISKAYIESKANNPEYFKHEVFPTKGGILPWGYTENGDELYWLTVGASDEWHVIVYESRSSDYYEYNMGMVQFIYELVSGKLVCPAFPDDFPGEEYEFINC
ncbi:SMI1/KNR4 family protein [Clostridium felsineum]|uniref:SMI1/KNR4 family protein n=1 Tax=Clostridium felsineum TaxID=36839 RepID=UPI0009D0ED7F|nr:SMI1/KNR4 family protein [Clostridium felsineum]URZ02827.1 hypothetical protein CLAUR_028610 [Clostridium felsineum]